MSFALILIHFILFIPDSNCPELFTLLAFLFMQEYRDKKKKAKKPTDQNSFHDIPICKVTTKHIRVKKQKTGQKMCSWISWISK